MWSIILSTHQQRPSNQKIVASHTTLTESISEKYADVAIIANALPL